MEMVHFHGYFVYLFISIVVMTLPLLTVHVLGRIIMYYIPGETLHISTIFNLHYTATYTYC